MSSRLSEIAATEDFINETKPFHTKFNDSSVVVRYTATDSFVAKMFDELKTHVKISSHWDQRYEQRFGLYPILGRTNYSVWYVDATDALREDIENERFVLQMAGNAIYATDALTNVLTITDEGSRFKLEFSDKNDLGVYVTYEWPRDAKIYLIEYLTSESRQAYVDDTVDPRQSFTNAFAFMPPDLEFAANYRIVLSQDRIKIGTVSEELDYTVSILPNGLHVLTLNHQVPSSFIIEAVGNIPHTSLLLNKKNLFSFISDGTAFYRKFSIPVVSIPRINRRVSKNNFSVVCIPINVVDGKTKIFRMPFTADRYFSIFRNDVQISLGVDCHIIDADLTTNTSARLIFNTPQSASDKIELRVNYFESIDNSNRRFRIPFNCGFKLLKNGIHTNEFIKLSDNVIQMNMPLLPSDRIDIEYWTYDKFTLYINDKQMTFSVWSEAKNLRTQFDTSNFDVDPYTTPDDILISIPQTKTFISGIKVPKLYFKDTNKDIWDSLNPEFDISDRDLEKTGWDPIELPFDFNEWDGSYYSGNCEITISELMTQVGDRTVIEKFCTLEFANVPKLGTKIALKVQMDGPYLNHIQSRFSDSGFINMFTRKECRPGFDLLPEYDVNGHLVVPQEYLTGWDICKFDNDATEITEERRRIDLIQSPIVNVSYGYDQDLTGDDVGDVEFDNADGWDALIRNGRYWI